MTEEDYKTLHGLLSWFINSAQDEFNQGSYSAENIGMVEETEEKGHGKH